MLNLQLSSGLIMPLGTYQSLSTEATGNDLCALPPSLIHKRTGLFTPQGTFEAKSRKYEKMC